MVDETDFISIIGDETEGSSLVRALSTLENFSDLDLQNNANEISWNYDDIEILIKRTSIKRLFLTHCNLSSFNVFTIAFNSLAVVNISFNNFKDLSCLSAAHHLRILDISHNRICSISFVSSLSQLTSLRCHNNSIESLRELKNAPLIQELWVSNNDIQWQQYIYLSSLKSLEILIKSDKEKSNEDKKIDNFLLSVVPSLKILDGGAVKAIADQTVSIDVKIMLTQARAALQESVNIESQENNRVTASKGISKKKSPAVIGKIKRQSSKSSQVLEELDISSAVDDDGAVTSTSTTENALDSDVITSHRSAPSSRSSFANPTQSSTSGDLIAANQPANIGQVSAKHGRSTMAAARKIPKKYPGTAIIGSPNPTAEDIGSGQQLEVATTESAPRTLVKFNSTTSDAPIALCIYPNNDGYARYVSILLWEFSFITFSM